MWGLIDGRAEGLGDPQNRCRVSAIQPAFQSFGIYLFLISFACVYYLSNASLLLGHYDLGWHLAAGDLIRERGNFPPGSMVIHPCRQAMVQSFVGLGRDGQCIVSVYEIQRPDISCSRMRRSHRRISRLRLLEQRSLGTCSLYFGFLRMPALPLFCDSPAYLCRRFAEHRDDAVLRSFLRGMSEKDAMVLAACVHGALGQSAWRFSAWFSGCRHFLLHGLAQAGLGRLQDLRPGGTRLLHCDIHQSSRLAHLRRAGGDIGHFVQANITEWHSYYQNITVPGNVAASIPASSIFRYLLGLNCATEALIPLRWSRGCLPGCSCCWDFINSDTCPSFSYSQRFRWRSTSTGCCPGA